MNRNIGSKSRNSSIELLRIICMVLIILSHYVDHMGGGEDIYKYLIIEKCVLDVLSFGGKLSCLIFILISGYFMISSKVNYKRIIFLAVKGFLYSWLILIIASFLGVYKIGVSEIISSLVPILYQNWFVGYYIVFTLFIPMINDIVKGLNKAQYTKLLIVLGSVFSIIPTFTLAFKAVSKFDMFLLVYLIGGYIKLYSPTFFKYNLKNCVICAIVMLIFICSAPLLDILSVVIGVDALSEHAKYFYQFHNTINIICAILLFSIFKNITFYSKIVNWIATSVLGIYLIHDHSIMRKIIWQIVLPNKDYFMKDYFILHLVGKVFGVFVICLILDKIYDLLLKKKIYKLIDYIYSLKKINYR